MPMRQRGANTEEDQMLEMAAVPYDGEFKAEQALSQMRADRSDEWLSDVGVIEHDREGRYSVKAKNPKVDEGKVGKGAAIGGATGLFIGAIGGPLGLLLWGSIGALTGAGIGAVKESAFKPTVELLKDSLPPDASMLVLVGETPTIDAFVAATGGEGRAIREGLTSEQAKELSEARVS
jgi:uncharacterized membrane protein